MNRHLHRIVFNAARGMRMVVQETASSTGRGKSRATSGSSGTASAVAAVALFGLLAASPGQAQIVGAPNVPGNLRPTVLIAPNGVPLINIQSPSAAGVSRNVYNQLNVGPNGAIFNNSRTNVQTQLGGFVQGNPYLAGGPARIILNEVNGGNVSQLRGYMEVAGQRAEIIIANPAGINVDGAGFINASRATLTTGMPQFNALGGLDSFLVRGGTVTINGAGLDASKTDYAAILARAVEANAGIWASELKVVTGANQVSADHSQISPTTGTGAAPTFALDVAALGGMYAGKIVLIGTEAGLGVRNAGTIQAAPGTPALAGAGQLVVTSAGRLENIGTIQATADANLAASNLANSGRISSGGNLKVATQDTLANSFNGTVGTLEGARVELASAAGNIDNRNGGTIRQASSVALGISAPTLSNTGGGAIGLESVPETPSQPGGGTTSPSTGSGTGTGGGTAIPGTPTAGSSSGSDGTITPAPYVPPSPGAITAAGAILNDGGRIYAGGPITLQSANISNNGGTMSLASMTVAQPTFDNHGGTLNISNVFSANVDRFDNTGGKLNAGTLNIASSGDLINVDGTLTSATDANLTIGGKADNTRGTISATGALTAKVAGATNNTGGTLVSNQGLTLNAGSLDNSKGSIQSTQAGAQLTVTYQLVNGSGGAIGAATDLNVQAGELTNSGSLRGANDVSVAVGGALTNDGSITAGRNTTITAGSLQSSSAGVLGAGVQNDGKLGSTGDLRVTTSGALAANGNNIAAGNATLQGASVDLSGSQTSAANIAVTATQGDVTTSKATVVTPGTLSVTANAQAGQALTNQGGKLSANQLDLKVSNIANTQGGEIIQTGTGASSITTSGAIDNSGGTLASNGRLAFTAASLNNKGGTLRAAQASDLTVTVAGLVDNRQGEMSAGGNTTLQAGSLDNDAGRITAAGDVSSTTSGATSNQGGTIAANGSTILNAGSLNNIGGTVSALNSLTANVQGAVDNTSGTLVANQALALDAGSLVNDKGSIQSTQAASRLNVGGALANGSGYIGAATDLNIKAGSLANAGSLRGANDTTIAVNGQLANDGNITAGRNTTITAGSVQGSDKSVFGAGIQSDGKLATKGELNVRADGALVANGTNLAAGNATLQGASVDLSASQTSAANIAVTATQGDVVTSKATVVTLGTLSVTANSSAAQTLVNDAGKLNANQLDLKLSNLANTNGGEIVQTGTGAATIAMGGTLNNDGGRIASNGQDLTLQAVNIGNAAGKIEHAGAGTLNIAGGNYSGTNGQITTNGALVVAMSGAFNQDGDKATTSAKRITIDAGSLSNRGGQIVQTGADATRITVVGAVDNSAGTIAGNGNMNVAAGSLANQGGTIRAAEASSLGLTVGGLLDNSNKGVIGGGGNTTVAAGSLNNNAGSVTAVGDLSATVGGAATNVGGTLAANGNTTLVADTLDNSSGTVAAVKGNLSVTTTGATTNDAGTLQAGAKTTLLNGGLSNIGGKVLGDSLSVDTRGNMLNNAQGTLAATTTVAVNSGALANDAGLIQSGGAMTIDTNGKALSNTNATGYSTKQGGITSADTLDLKVGTVNNAAGFIGSKNALVAKTQAFSNTGGGVVFGQSTAVINTNGATYDNSGGQTQAMGDLSVNAGSINNNGGLVRSLVTTTLNTGSIVNANTQGTDQGIEGKNIAIGVGDLNNTSGAIRSDVNATITSGGTVTNTNGLISAGNTLSIVDPNRANPASKTLNVVNTGGTLVAGTAAVLGADSKVQAAAFGKLEIDAKGFSGDGTTVGVNNLSIALAQDVTNNVDVRAGGNLTYATTGKLTNNGKLLAGGTVTASGNEVENTANGEMTGSTTVVSAANALTNRGLLDGYDTQINAGTVNNIGTGRIYGDAISIAAGTLNNDAETDNGVTKAGTIAARDTLDIGASTINNREHALLFSAGDMYIGGGLDANRQAIGKGGALNNLSASIESLGNMSIAMGQINNFDNHFAVTRTSSGPVNGKSTITPLGGVELPTEAFVLDRAGRVWSTMVNGQVVSGKGWIERQYTTTTEVDQPANPPDPGRIYSGGNMTIDGKLHNRDSQVMAGGQFNIDPANVDNTPTQGQRIVTVSGLQVYVPAEKGNNLVPGFIPEQKSVYTIDVGASCINDCTGGAPSGKKPDAAQSVAVSDRARSAGEVTAGTRARAILEVPSAVGGVIKTGGTTAAGAGAVDGASDTTAVQSGTGATNVSTNGSAGGTASSAQAGSAQTIPMVVRTSLPNTAIPTTSLFGIHAGPGGYLVETDPRFANYRTWLSSDYLLNSLGQDPNTTLKRLGDGFYEQKLIREQVAQLTGYRFLDGYHNDEEQYTALMNAGGTFAKEYGLRPGIALTPAQMAQLTSDIVWLVEQTVTLPDGTTQRVLVPQVYVRVQPGDITGSGSVLSADRMMIRGAPGSGDLTNSGTIAGRTLVSITADNINNLGGRIAGGSVVLDAKNDINNIGGSITGANSVSLQAGHDINIETTTNTQAGWLASKTNIDRVAGVYVTNPGGTLIASAGNDVNVIGGILSNKGPDSFTSVTAGKNINLGTVTESSSRLSIFNANTYSGDAASKEIGSTIVGNGTVLLNAKGGDINARAATVDAGSGLLSLAAAGDINITSGVDAEATMGAGQSTNKSFLKSTTTTFTGESQSSTSIGSSFTGGIVAMDAGNNLNIEGARIAGRDGVALHGGNSVNIYEARDTASVNSGFDKKTSGLNFNPTLGAIIGPRGNGSTLEIKTDIAAPTSISSEKGGVLIEGGVVNMRGVQVAAAKDIKIEGGDVNIAAAENRLEVNATETSRGGSFNALGFHSFGKGINAKNADKMESSATSLTRTTLNGANVNIAAIGTPGSAGGTLNLAGTTVNTPGTLTLKGNQVNLLPQNTETSLRNTSQGGDVAWQKTTDKGTTDQKLNYNQFNVGQLAINANHIQAGLGAKDSVEALGKQPGMDWVNQLQNDPKLKDKVDWVKVEEAHKNWDYRQQGLTPEASAVITVVVAYFTAGAASGIGGAAGDAAAVGAGQGIVVEGATFAAGSSVGAVVGGAVTAGISALASQVAVALINNQGDIGRTLHDLGSSSSVKNLLTAIVTGGVLGGLNMNPTGLPTVDGGAQQFMTQLGQNMTAGAARAVIGTAINGGSFEKNLGSALKGALLDTIAAQGAKAIGDMKDDGTLNDFTNKIAHAIAGCMVGAARADSAGGCGAGALGAAVGELAAEVYGRQADTVEFAAMMAGIAVAITGADASQINLGSQAGSNAAANNYLSHDEAEKRDRLKEEKAACQTQACRDEKQSQIDTLTAVDRWRDRQLKNACTNPAAKAQCGVLYADLQAAGETYKDIWPLATSVRAEGESIRADLREYAFAQAYPKTYGALTAGINTVEGLMGAPIVLSGLAGSAALGDEAAQLALKNIVVQAAVTVTDLPAAVKAKLDEADAAEARGNTTRATEIRTQLLLDGTLGVIGATSLLKAMGWTGLVSRPMLRPVAAVADFDGNLIPAFVADTKYSYVRDSNGRITGQNLEASALQVAKEENGPNFIASFDTKIGKSDNGLDLGFAKMVDGKPKLVIGEAKGGDSSLSAIGENRVATLDRNLAKLQESIQNSNLDSAIKSDLVRQIRDKSYEVELYVGPTNAAKTTSRVDTTLVGRLGSRPTRVITFQQQ
jgi:filamentous hemagglutinin